MIFGQMKLAQNVQRLSSESLTGSFTNVVNLHYNWTLPLVVHRLNVRRNLYSPVYCF